MTEVIDFFPIYPAIDDEDFNQRIYNKKEFYDEKLDAFISTKKGWGLLKHQKFIARFLSPYTPYTGLLLYHEMGTGKTCSAVGTFELAKRQNSTIKKAIYIARGDLLIEKFIKEVLEVCTPGTYKISDNIKEQKKEVKKVYSFYKYHDLAKAFKRETKSKPSNDLRNEFSNAIIIIDEIQNIRHKGVKKKYQPLTVT